MPLQQVGGNEKEVVQGDRPQSGPPAPLPSPLLVTAGILRRGDDGIRISGQHRLQIDSSGQDREVGKDVAASAEGDGLADQLFAVDGHQRSMPYFIEDPYRRCTCVAVTQSLQPFTKSFCELVGNRVGARQPAQRLDLFGDIVEPSGFADENGESQRTQPFDVPGAVAALPG